MRRLLAATVLPLVLAACGDQGPDQAAQYREAVRCYNAADSYSQQFVVGGDNASAGALLGYAFEVKARAISMGSALNIPAQTTRDELKGANDTDYLHKFFTFGGGTMTATDFGKGEVDHCHLDAVMQ